MRRARPGDVAPIAASLARAFAHDPVACYLFPAAARREASLRRFFALQLRHHYLPRGEVFTTAERDAAALWMPPSAAPPDLARQLADVLLLAPVLRGRLLAARQLARLLAAHHPEARHYYLGTLGTDPRRQGEGRGSALLQPVLEACDRSGTEAYLECSRAGTVPFYVRHGFRVTAQVTAPAGGPTLWLMARRPRA
ncbi:MAG TPA: GNAT family N-acetyltransferase [Acidimicrobiales bacterium]|nr:GNAT family N-acetyltransferase [Acidimicrobiales bacterium]